MSCNFHHVGAEDKNILVFDFGGGTFDITIACVSDGSIDVQATRGDMNLGGLNLDNVIYDLCVEQIRANLERKDGGKVDESQFLGLLTTSLQ